VSCAAATDLITDAATARIVDDPRLAYEKVLPAADVGDNQPGRHPSDCAVPFQLGEGSMKRGSMKTRGLAVMMFAISLAIGTLAWAAGPSGGKPAISGARVVTLRGTVEAVNKEQKTVTLKGPKGGTLTLNVKDPQKLDAIAVGDPVVAKYYESVAIEVRKPGQATPGVTKQESVATSKPGETPAGVVGEQITVTATVTAIDTKAQTVTITGPEGRAETVKARDPKNLAKIKVGDLVEITYTRALAIALDKAPAATSKK